MSRCITSPRILTGLVDESERAAAPRGRKEEPGGAGGLDSSTGPGPWLGRDRRDRWVRMGRAPERRQRREPAGPGRERRGRGPASDVIT